MTQDHKAILDKVKALIAKAQGGTTEGEADACMRLAHSLLEKYNLSMSDLPTDEEQDPVGRTDVDEMYMTPWRNRVFSAAARLYFCDGFHSHWYDEKAHDKATAEWREEWQAFNLSDDADDEFQRRMIWKRKPQMDKYFRPRVVLVGRPHNRAVAAEMIPYLYRTVVRLAREYAKALSEEDLAMQGISRRKAQLDFEAGCGDRVADRLWRLAYEAELAQRKAQKKGPSTAVTLYDQFETENKAFMEGLGLKKRRTGGINLDSEHAEAGVKAGDEVSLNAQVGATGKRVAALPAPPKALPSK